MLRYGVLGTNWIAERNAKAIQAQDNMSVDAVCARTKEKVDAFADKMGIAKRYYTAQDMASDTELDCVYVSSPHGLHFDHVELFLKSGKHVICEKPFVMNAREAETLFKLADERGLCVMEAMWTRFLPAVKQMQSAIDNGIIGEVRQMDFQLSFASDLSNTTSRLLDPGLGGGALLDIGVYCLTMADVVMRSEPIKIVSAVHKGETNVDLRSSVLLQYEDGCIAHVHTAIDVTGINNNIIYGTKGRIEFEPCFAPTYYTVTRSGASGNEVERFDGPFELNGYEYQYRAFAKLVETRVAPDELKPSDTLRIMTQMDTLRKEWCVANAY